MEVISPCAPMMSTLNPDAPMYVPTAYRAVEDFSDEWWSLVHSSPWFHDYWLQERFVDPQTDLFDDQDDDDESSFAELDCFFDFNSIINQEEDDDDNLQRDLVSLKNRRKVRSAIEAPKYNQKPAKIVNVKLSPRPIQQPR
ncbi:protein EARLY RESPONSIVE TO DEHYDRATION 15-like [Impatiens glandulifera]|uniref:protein EARLY RESPONSIVE TO DEHYDRATION 15-like n=1 Tax=Impatiens glandulifera TaxID=253017 RepID=UPI001FB172B1|nr:protein EARLY RESPONSIVE TO DEHYDRATION 15-like [Impatiens glandulifera]XP_047327279.1 protein EARLY RESPONSIVE TO DEHYDRATION 15-like [Impatiens glandulifera]